MPKTKQVVLGAAAGVAASAVMSGVMAGAQRVGLMGKAPPKKITQRALDRLRLRRGRGADELATAFAHLGYGSASGALFSRAASGRVLPQRPIAEGMLFGSLVWLVSYFGWVPALGILPSPARDRPGRALTMFAAHLVFGAVLGALSPRRALR